MPRFSLADSASSVLEEASALLRSEVRLVKAEVAQNVNNLKTGIILVAGAALLALLGVGQLLDAATALLIGLGFTPAAAAGIVGGAVLVVALLLGWIGSRRLSAESLTPARSIEALRSRPAAGPEVQS